MTWQVEYQCEGFLEKNRDRVYEEQINILKASQVLIRANKSICYGMLIWDIVFHKWHSYAVVADSFRARPRIWLLESPLNWKLLERTDLIKRSAEFSINLICNIIKWKYYWNFLLKNEDDELLCPFSCPCIYFFPAINSRISQARCHRLMNS